MRAIPAVCLSLLLSCPPFSIFCPFSRTAAVSLCKSDETPRSVLYTSCMHYTHNPHNLRTAIQAAALSITGKWCGTVAQASARTPMSVSFRAPMRDPSRSIRPWCMMQVGRSRIASNAGLAVVYCWAGRLFMRVLDKEGSACI